jgi:hypothetical protein
MMATVKFTVCQKDHLVPTLVCAIQFTLGIACLTVIISNFLATLFRQLLSLALVSLTIYVTCFLLPIGMQKHSSVSTHNISQSNLCIATCSSLNCPLAGIHHNLRIVTHSSLSYPPIGIHRTLFLRSSSVPLPGKTVLMDMRGLLFLFVHWFNEGCCVEGGASPSSSFIGLMRVVVLNGGR